MRGATAYATRGTALALPRGTVDNPAIRFGGTRSGVYGLGDGALAVSINRFLALGFSDTDVLIRSNTPGDELVVPLALERANATTGDLQETALDIQEVGTTVGRLASYRQNTTQYGWRLYGSTGGSLTPDLQISGDGDLFARRDITAARNLKGVDVHATQDVISDRDVTVARNLSVGGALSFGTTGSASAPRLTLTAPPPAVALTVVHDASIGGQLTLSRAATQRALWVQTGLAEFGGGVNVSGGPITMPLGATGSYFDGGNVGQGDLRASVLRATSMQTGTLAASVSVSATGPIGNRLGVDGDYFNGGNIGQGDLRAHWLRAAVMEAESLAATGGLTLGQGATFGYDLILNRSGATPSSPTTGAIFFGAATPAAYLYWDATTFTLSRALSIECTGTALTVPNGSGSVGLDWIVGRNLQVYGTINGGLTTGGSISASTFWAGASISAPVVSVPVGVANNYFNGGNTGNGDVRAYWLRASAMETVTLTTTGNAAVGGALTINGGGTSLAIPVGSFSVGYDGVIGRNLQVNGYYNGGVTSAGTFNINTVNIGGPLTVTGNATFNGVITGNLNGLGLQIGYDASIGRKLSVGPGGVIILQDAANPQEGFRANFSGHNFYLGIGPSGHGQLVTNSSIVQLSSTQPAIFPDSDARTDLGLAGYRWRYGWIYALGVQLPLNTSAPSYALHLGVDQAGKPGTNTWQVWSDRRTKVAESIRDYEDGLDTLLKLRPITYRYNGLAGTEGAMDREYVGLVAEEAQAVAPELVRSARAKLRPKDTDETDVLTIDSHPLTYMLLNAVRTLSERLTRLEEAS